MEAVWLLLEKNYSLIEYATKKGLTVILICALQVELVCRRHFKFNANGKNFCRVMFINRVQIYYIFQYLTSPTTGGVTASFAMLEI
jgi:acetyl-CoA carboxylase beta subunit